MQHPRNLSVSPDLQAGLESLRAAVITDLVTPDDIAQYRSTAQERAADRALLQHKYQMRAETVQLTDGTIYERYVAQAGTATDTDTDTDTDDTGLDTVTATPHAPAARGIIVFVHGGGLIAGNRFDGVDVVLEPAAELGLEVWSVEYGLAPATAFSTAVATCLKVVEVALAAEIGPVVIAGQSAGGGLATATARLDHELTGGRLVGQLLVCPMLDDRSATTSMHQFEADPSWSRISNITAWNAALAGDGGNTSQVPGRAESLAGLPPTFLDSGSAEVFRDDITGYAARLWAAGVPTELHVWEGGFHGFDGVVPDAQVSRAARAARTTWLRRLFPDVRSI